MHTVKDVFRCYMHCVVPLWRRRCSSHRFLAHRARNGTAEDRFHPVGVLALHCLDCMSVDVGAGCEIERRARMAQIMKPNQVVLRDE